MRVATAAGSFYYEVNGEEYFYSAVSPRAEEWRLCAAGFAKLERTILKLVDGNQHLRLQLLLTRLAERAAGRRLRRVALLFDPDRTLVDQCARYLASYARRPPPEG